MYNEIIAHTTYGPVRGWTRHGVHVFKGIRYGADTAEYRFQRPREPSPWIDVANAFEFGPSCPQDPPDSATDRAQNPFLRKIGLTDNYPESEDCLFANVWTHGVQDGSRRPVMVWVHSGGFSANSGSSPSIDGTSLADVGDVVVVSFNHRLGVLGYTYWNDDPSDKFAGSGNVGMLDVVCLLKWVRNNIEEFGGDPENVTLFGQSGGAMKISALLAMPKARGLFHKAILSSGASAKLLSLSNACAARDRLCAELGVSAPEAADVVAKMDLKDLMRAYHNVAQESMTSFGACVDGRVVIGQPGSSSACELSSDVPVIVGDLDTEAALFLAGSHAALSSLDDGEMSERLASLLGQSSAEDLLSAVRSNHPGISHYETAVRVVSDLMFCGQTRELAVARARAKGKVWRYRHLLRTPVDGGVLMSTHELDVALVFGNLEEASGLNGHTSDAVEFSRQVQHAWVQFARSGIPSTLTGVYWPEWKATDRDAEYGKVMCFDPFPRVDVDVDGSELRIAGKSLSATTDWIGSLLQ